MNLTLPTLSCSYTSTIVVPSPPLTFLSSHAITITIISPCIHWCLRHPMSFLLYSSSLYEIIFHSNHPVPMIYPGNSLCLWHWWNHPAYIPSPSYSRVSAPLYCIYFLLLWWWQHCTLSLLLTLLTRYSATAVLFPCIFRCSYITTPLLPSTSFCISYPISIVLVPMHHIHIPCKAMPFLSSHTYDNFSIPMVSLLGLTSSPLFLLSFYLSFFIPLLLDQFLTHLVDPFYDLRGYPVFHVKVGMNNGFRYTYHIKKQMVPR